MSKVNRFDVISIFPEYLSPLNLSLIGKAHAAGLIELGVHDLRAQTTDVHGSVDSIAENIRKLGGYAPGSYSRFQELSTVSEASKVIPPAMDMLRQLYDDNEIIIASIERSYELAEMNHEHGISNFLAERDGIHKKYRWFLRSTLANR